MKTIVLVIIYFIGITAKSQEWAFFHYGNTGFHFSRIIDIDENDRLWVTSGKNNVILRDSLNWTEYENYFEFITPEFLGNFGVINDIVIDKDTSFWIASTSGLVHYKNHSWKVYDTNNSSILNNYVESIIIDDYNNIWIGHDFGGISKLTNDKWEIFNSENSPLGYSFIRTVEKDKKNKLLIGTRDIFFIFENGQWHSYNLESIFNANFIDVNSIAVDRENNIWLFVDMYGIAKFDGNNWITFDLNSGIADDFLTCIAVDSSSNIFVGSNRNGIYKFDGIEWKNYNSDNSPCPNSIVNIVIDSKNQKWIDLGGAIAVYKEGGVLFQSKTAYSNCIHPFVYPNPFDDFTNIEITDNHNSIYLEVYNLMGNLVDIIYFENQEKKRYSFQYDGRHLSPGLYIVRGLMENYPYDCTVFFLHKR